MKIYGDEYLTYSEDEIPPVLRWVTPNSRVLEFGPAMGYMTKYLAGKLNCTVTGIELNPQMAKNVEKYAEKVIIANLDFDEWEKDLSGKYDFIIFGDVLEHLRNPKLVLQKAIGFLSTTGSVLTSIPNIGHSAILLSLIEGEFEYQDYGLLDNTHIHFFTRESIKQMMNECNLACTGENNTISPNLGNVVFRKFFFFHPMFSFFVLRRKDTSVVQFVNKWEFRDLNKQYMEYSGYQLSFWRLILTFLDDINEYLAYKYKKKITLPLFLKKRIRGNK